MAEFTSISAQTVAAKGNVVFSNTAVKGSNCIQSFPTRERGLKYQRKEIRGD